MHGDFNINLLSVQSNGLCSDYLSLINSYNLLNTILRPTRVSNTSFTLIDNIWFGSCADLSKSGIIMSNITDHYAISCVFDERQASSSDSYVEISKRMLTANNREQLKNAIANYDS